MLDSLFGPLGKENCVVFQIVSVFSFVMFLILLVLGIMSAKKNKAFLGVILGATSPLVLYYIYRLLYSMCLGSL